MRKIVVLFIVCFFSITSSSQDIYEPISDLTDEDKEIIEDAKKYIERGNRMVENAENDYQKYIDLFTHKRKWRRRRAEKKTVPAKRNLIAAGNYYHKGYELLYNLYSEKLELIEFEFEEDKQKADDLASEAENSFNNGKNSLQSNKNYSDKDLKKEVTYKSLENKIKTGAKDEKEAVEDLCEALGIYETQKEKKVTLKKEDKKAWQKALMENSINSYQNYIDKYPNGSFVEQAKIKIEELEEKIRIAQQQQDNPDLVYHIQIMADTRKWTTQEIKNKIYYTNEKIEEQYINGWYKYWIGTFETYDQAKAYLSKVRKKRKGAFVVATVNGQFVDILQAINVEQNKD